MGGKRPLQVGEARPVVAKTQRELDVAVPGGQGHEAAHHERQRRGVTGQPHREPQHREDPTPDHAADPDGDELRKAEGRFTRRVGCHGVHLLAGPPPRGGQTGPRSARAVPRACAGPPPRGGRTGPERPPGPGPWAWWATHSVSLRAEPSPERLPGPPSPLPPTRRSRGPSPLRSTRMPPAQAAPGPPARPSLHDPRCTTLGRVLTTFGRGTRAWGRRCTTFGRALTRVEHRYTTFSCTTFGRV